jgi:hypothetical protein
MYERVMEGYEGDDSLEEMSDIGAREEVRPDMEGLREVRRGSARGTTRGTTVGEMMAASSARDLMGEAIENHYEELMIAREEIMAEPSPMREMMGVFSVAPLERPRGGMSGMPRRA